MPWERWFLSIVRSWRSSTVHQRSLAVCRKRRCHVVGWPITSTLVLRRLSRKTDVLCEGLASTLTLHAKGEILTLRIFVRIIGNHRFDTRPVQTANTLHLQRIDENIHCQLTDMAVTDRWLRKKSIEEELETRWILLGQGYILSNLVLLFQTSFNLEDKPRDSSLLHARLIGDFLFVHIQKYSFLFINFLWKKERHDYINTGEMRRVVNIEQWRWKRIREAKRRKYSMTHEISRRRRRRGTPNLSAGLRYVHSFVSPLWVW